MINQKKDFSPTVKKLKDVPMDHIDNTSQFESYLKTKYPKINWDRHSNRFTDIKYVVNHAEDEWVNILETGNYISDEYDCIFTLPNEDSHFEHRIVNNMTPALVRHKRIGIISYRTPSTLDNWIPNFYVEIDLDEKIEYLNAFESQLEKPYFSEKSIKSFHSNYQCSKKDMEYVELFRIEGIYSK